MPVINARFMSFLVSRPGIVPGRGSREIIMATDGLASGRFAPMILTASAAAIWRYRNFVLGAVRREFELRYRGSMLGSLWNVLNPLAMIAVYTIIFSGLMQARLPGVDSTFAYSIYLCAGIFSWGLFTEIVSRGQTVFLDNANLIKKLSFPRVCLPM